MKRTPDSRARSLAAMLFQSWPRAVRPPQPVMTTRRVMRVSGGRRREQLLDHLLHVADGTHMLEVLGADLAAGELLELDDHVHGIDAVEIQVLVEARLGRDLARLDVELLDQRVLEGFEDVLWEHAGSLKALVIGLVHAGNPGDRKSTRLNSSHV